MTVKPDALTDIATKLRQFPEFPPREDMQNPLYLYRPSHITALAVFLGNPETTLVLGEVPVSPTLNYRAKVRIPDLTVSYRCNPSLVIEQRGYAIDSQGKAPDFVLEVASVTTGRIDYTEKRLDYESFGIAEYWRFDPTGGDYYDAALAGDRLVDGRYRQIETEWLDDERCHGYSEALGLYVCWKSGQLRWYDPDSGSYLRTHEEEIIRAERAEAELRRLKERLDAPDDGD